MGIKHCTIRKIGHQEKSSIFDKYLSKRFEKLLGRKRTRITVYKLAVKTVKLLGEMDHIGK